MGQPGWQVDMGQGEVHEVTFDEHPGGVKGLLVSPFPHEFRCDGIEHPLPKLEDNLRVASFDIDGHPSTLTMRLVRPSYWRRFIRALVHRFDPFTPVWAIYELKVEGQSRGFRVAKAHSGSFQFWTDVDPGGSLPDSSMSDWPPGTNQTSHPYQPPYLHKVLTVDQLLGGGPWDRRLNRPWSHGLEQTVRALHALLTARSAAVPGRLTISYRIQRGSKALPLAQINVYDGRLYFPGGNLDKAGGSLAKLQAGAREAGMRAAGTWIEIPVEAPARSALLQLVDEQLSGIV